MRKLPIIDSHCHAWTYWPYSPPVPDPRTCARVEQLVFAMDDCGVDKALIVCARIKHNPRNNDYVAAEVARRPERLYQAADLDCEWTATYHRPGAAQRLRAMAARWPLKAFTHYLRKEEDGSWLYSPEGLEVFRAARELGLLASLACYPHQQAAVRKAAERSPEVPFLVHHLGLVHQGSRSSEDNLQDVLESARIPNIYIKVSGFGYPAEHAWEYPYPAARETLRMEYEHFGPRRLCWGSDYPVVRYYMTYRQSLEVLRRHCEFIPAGEMDWVTGGNLAGLLGESSA
jgi:L-fuconolactonase